MGGNWEAKEKMSDDRNGTRVKDPKRKIRGLLEDSSLEEPPALIWGSEAASA